MNQAFIKRIKELKGNGKLTDFEHNQLLCLSSISSSLVSIDDSLNNVSLHLSQIFDKTGKKGSPQLLWTKDKDEEDEEDTNNTNI